MKSRNLTLGIIVLCVGVIALLRSLNILVINWDIVWNLWPLMLIILGVCILPINKYIKVILAVISLAAGVVLYQYEAKNHTERHHYWWNHISSSTQGDDDKTADDVTQRVQTFSEPYENYDNATLNIEFGAGELNLGASCAELVDINCQSNFATYNFRSEKLNRDIQVYLADKGETKGLKKAENELNIALNDSQVWDFAIQTGASECDLDFSRYLAKNINIEGGACDLDIVLGSHNDTTFLNIETGVSDIDIKLPRDRACQLILDSALSGKDIVGLDKMSDKEYRSSDFGSTTNPIIIKLSCGLSDVDVERE